MNVNNFDKFLYIDSKNYNFFLFVISYVFFYSSIGIIFGFMNTPVMVTRTILVEFLTEATRTCDVQRLNIVQLVIRISLGLTSFFIGAMIKYILQK